MGGGKYPVELVEVREIWPGHHGYQKTKMIEGLVLAD